MLDDYGDFFIAAHPALTSEEKQLIKKYLKEKESSFRQERVEARVGDKLRYTFGADIPDITKKHGRIWFKLEFDVNKKEIAAIWVFTEKWLENILIPSQGEASQRENQE